MGPRTFRRTKHKDHCSRTLIARSVLFREARKTSRSSGGSAHRTSSTASEDFTKNGQTYDVIFDAVGKHSFRLCRHSLKPRGIYVSMDLGYGYHLPFLGLITKLLGRKRATVGIGRYRKADLLLIKDLVEAGKYRPVIDRTYSMDEIVEAVSYVESGQKTGNVVIRVTA